MQDIEPFYNWENFYDSSCDRHSPFYGMSYNLYEYTNDIYGYYIHPLWDYIGSETLYIKILYADYERKIVIIELFGEWNDAINNDIMFLKRNIIDHFTNLGINKYILIGENVLNFHGSDDCYYEEWFDDIEDGWIAAVGFREHVLEEWNKYALDYYIFYGESLQIDNWRTLTPMSFYKLVESYIHKRLPAG
ncbi:MAG: hypothetical protein NZ529_08110 [Cytophagaceae bacterium]|nr:hypothetical protein [Cytophagaceae bacterium]MDW8456746.1 hypothetical protein [Cytophagaceae bacterium]